MRFDDGGAGLMGKVVIISLESDMMTNRTSTPNNGMYSTIYDKHNPKQPSYMQGNYSGTEGVVRLTHWFEKLESIFRVSNVKDGDNMKYVPCTMLDGALTWWNSYVQTVGIDAANAIPWSEFKQILIKKYYPRSEVLKMETKEMVTPEAWMIECYVGRALYAKSCGCSKGGFADKFFRDSNKTLDSSQRPPQDCPKCGNPVDGLYCRHYALLRKKLKEVWFTVCDEHNFFQDTSESSNDDYNVVNAPQEPIIFNQDPDKNSSQSPTQIDHHCCYGCGNSLDGIFCLQCTCKYFGKGDQYGYIYTLKVSIISNPEPCHDQNVEEIPQALPSFHPTCYSGDENSFAYDSTSNLVKDSPNVFNPPSQPLMYSYEFYGEDAHYSYDCPPQVPFIYDPEPCYNQYFNFPQNIQSFQQQYPCCENCGGPHETFQCQQVILYDPCCENCGGPHETVQSWLQQRKDQVCQKIPLSYDDDAGEESSIPLSDIIIFKLPLCIEITPVVSTKDSLIMGDEHLDTISEKVSNKFIKSSVENLVPNLSESEDEQFIFENSDVAIKSFSPSPIPVEDSDSLRYEIDLSLTPDDLMPPGIEDDDYDSKGGILILEELLSNDSFLLPEKESFHFDIPSSPPPPAKPPDDDEIEPNSRILTVKVVGDIFEHYVPMPRLLPTQPTHASSQEKSHLLSH
nr:putative reverse transcriptase domain-containing protein [Tanacetum cinerariifolium]GEV78206.1 putative reverse transcriptase domain-containing protein [Tanacetum cinerariifolium]